MFVRPEQTRIRCSKRRRKKSLIDEIGRKGLFSEINKKYNTKSRFIREIVEFAEKSGRNKSRQGGNQPALGHLERRSPSPFCRGNRRESNYLRQERIKERTSKKITST